VRKSLGVLAAVAAVCALMWAQAPAQTPASDPAPAPAVSQPSAPPESSQATNPQAPAPQPPAQESTSLPAKPAAPVFPRTELFGGYSFAQAGFFNAGHWAQLNGWNASLTLNADKMIGFVVDGGEFFGNTKIPNAVPAPFPVSQAPYCSGGATCLFNANTREYNILFGVQFAYRKHERLTPFGEVMFGHDGVRGIATGSGDVTETEVSSGLALLAGAGVDRKINERFALRVKADYLQTRTSFGGSLGKAKQDNLRVSVGIVMRSVRKKKRTLEEETGVEP